MKSFPKFSVWVAMLLACAQAGISAAVLPSCDSGTTGQDGTLEGIQALRITPETAVINVPVGEGATRDFVAMGTFADGSERDVTNLVEWTTDLQDATVTKGHLVVGPPGQGMVVAAAADLNATADVTVKVAGVIDLPGTPDGAGSALDGTPEAAAEPTIAYPLDGALFPFNLGDTEFHIAQADPNQTVARIDVTGDLIDLQIVGPCEPMVGKSNACAVVLTSQLVPILAGASESENMQIRVRVAAPDGSSIGESEPVDVRWTFTGVGGGLYYWSAIDNGATAIFRFDLDAQGTPPEKFFSQDMSPPLHDGTQTPCVGCHSLSLDGTKMGLSFGGSDPSDFALIDVATADPIAVQNTDANGFATFSALSPDASRVVTALRGKLTLRAANESLANTGDLAPAETQGEALTQPFWSADGSMLAYVGWVPNQNGASGSFNGDVARGAQIFLSQWNADSLADTTVLVAREQGKSNYYPAISDDGEWVIFNRSSCDGPPGFHPYGNDPCDGYDDASARVYAVSTSGGAPIALNRLNGTDTWTNSWPRWSPSHGKFRGKAIYFVAFSSKRPYGLRLDGSNTGASVPQLWLGAIALDSQTGIADPSFAPVWLPLQNEDMQNPTGNHVPQWAAKALPIPK
ncbi:MAG: hypothetical protein IPK82_35000 [Polyangiaceae bacterium]|nr:hypothetical protein [Polyangiaceae bacterium]